MKKTYPIILKPDDGGYYVRIPDFDIGTQGDTISEAVMMAKDAIGLTGIDMQDEGMELPEPGSKKAKPEPGEIIKQVDVDFDEYRRNQKSE